MDESFFQSRILHLGLVLGCYTLLPSAMAEDEPAINPLTFYQTQAEQSQQAATASYQAQVTQWNAAAKKKQEEQEAAEHARLNPAPPSPPPTLWENTTNPWDKKINPWAQTTPAVNPAMPAASAAPEAPTTSSSANPAASGVTDLANPPKLASPGVLGGGAEAPAAPNIYAPGSAATTSPNMYQ